MGEIAAHLLVKILPKGHDLVPSRKGARETP